MARLIVEAVSNEKNDGQVSMLRICVSVSRAEDGRSVTGLQAANFRITNLGQAPQPEFSIPDSAVFDYELLVSERKWDPEDTTPSGVYNLLIRRNLGGIPAGDLSIESGENYAFGIQVRVAGRGTEFTEFGQTVISLTSLASPQGP